MIQTCEICNTVLLEIIRYTIFAILRVTSAFAKMDRREFPLFNGPKMKKIRPAVPEKSGSNGNDTSYSIY